MKNKIITMLSVFLALVIVAPFSSFADAESAIIPAGKTESGGYVLNDADETKDPDSVLWAHNYPVRLLTYSDAEHTQPIETEWQSGEKTYYVLDCEKGYFATELYIANAEYIDGEYFIPGDEAPKIVIRYSLAGDVRVDGKVNARDVTLLMKCLVNTGTYWENYGKHLDFNRDGKINARDVADLMTQLVGKKSFYGGAQTDVKGRRDAVALGAALFGLGDRYDVHTDDGVTYQYGDLIRHGEDDEFAPYGKSAGFSAVIGDRAQLEEALALAAEPTESGNDFIKDDKDFIASPAEYLASVTDATFDDCTLYMYSFGMSNAQIIVFKGAYYVNETLVPVIEVYEGHPGIDCDTYTEHFMIIAFEKLPEGQPISPSVVNYFPL